MEEIGTVTAAEAAIVTGGRAAMVEAEAVVSAHLAGPSSPGR